ncbi:MAG: hypothetical protein ACK4K7_11270 [Allosphingosinicella sp.]|uniref:hypothetical protein n=1 Tax=Allosphingosinicella sp. TaxID=2823234 RepID=UPI003942E905
MFNIEFSRVATAALGAMFFATLFVGAAVGPAAAFDRAAPAVYAAAQADRADG